MSNSRLTEIIVWLPVVM